MQKLSETYKRCSKCGRYPFCKKIRDPSYCCEDWIKANAAEVKYLKNVNDSFENETLENTVKNLNEAMLDFAKAVAQVLFYDPRNGPGIAEKVRKAFLKIKLFIGNAIKQIQQKKNKERRMRKMNIQNELENYNTYKARISIREAEIQKIECEIVDIRTTNLDGMPKPKGYVKSNIEEQIIKKQEKIEEKQRYVKSLQLKIKIIEDLVKTLKKYNQDIIKMRFFSMMSIEDIATNKEKGRTAIQKTIEGSIKFMQIKYNQNTQGV